MLLIAAPTQAQDSFTGNSTRPWYYPDHVVIQFGGNIGMFSAGPGYSFLRDHMDAEVLYGLVPSFEGHTRIHIFTGKLSYRPWKINLKKDFVLEPLKVGTGISYSAGSQFHTEWPGRYPKDYYWWTNSYRFTPFLGPTLSKKVGSGLSLIKRVQAYAELGTNDLALSSYMSNKTLAFTEIWNIALGTRLVF
ncbi:MAG: hypothetical protein ACO1NZ_16690 [Adhaeribacter sp.]